MTKCCNLSAGMLKEPVTFERAAKTPSGAGGYSETWGTLAGAADRAKVKALSGSERFASDRIEATTRWRITVRYFAGLLESDRVMIRSRAYNIRFVNNVELADRWLEIDLDGGVAV